MTIGLAVAAVFVVAVGPHRVWQPAAGLSDTPGLSTSRANVVVVMTDDLDVATTRAALDLNLMPNLSSYIIDQGTDFAESYVTINFSWTICSMTLSPDQNPESSRSCRNNYPYSKCSWIWPLARATAAGMPKTGEPN